MSEINSFSASLVNGRKYLEKVHNYTEIKIVTNSHMRSLRPSDNGEDLTAQECPDCIQEPCKCSLLINCPNSINNAWDSGTVHSRQQCPNHKNQGTAPSSLWQIDLRQKLPAPLPVPHPT